LGSGLNESEPVPVHRPVTSIAGAGAIGDAGGDDVPHDHSIAPRHAAMERVAIDRI
jgi:hypothetical protein